VKLWQRFKKYLWYQDSRLGSWKRKKLEDYFLTEYLKQYNYCEAMISRFKEQKIQDYNMRSDQEEVFFFVYFTEYLKQYNLLWSYEIQDSRQRKYSRLQRYLLSSFKFEIKKESMLLL